MVFTTGGSQNTAIGASTLVFNDVGSYNTALGDHALFHSLGNNNIGIGKDGGLNLQTGDYNIYIGHSGSTTESNTIHIGSNQSATYIAGINGATASTGAAVYVDSQGKLGTVTSSIRYKDDVADMAGASDELMRLRPVTFHYTPPYDDGSRLLQYGLIAEEVAGVDPGLVQFTPEGAPQTVRYHFLVPMLVNEVQKQRRTIEEQAAQIAELARAIGRLESGDRPKP
jgi:hypothetical protein